VFNKFNLLPEMCLPFNTELHVHVTLRLKGSYTLCLVRSISLIQVSLKITFQTSDKMCRVMVLSVFKLKHFK
jgi:hypothetical protein